MTFLPIVARELLEAARRKNTYWSRLATAAMGLIIGGWLMIVMQREAPATLGLVMFVSLSIAACVYCLLVGVFRTADCLSEEKREGTLGLLFLTDLKGYDIVFGKLAATSLNAVYGLLALFPVMAIPLLVGGVTIGEFWRVVLVALNTLFFSLAVGMFCSAISRDERRAMVSAFLIVLFFAGGLPLMGAIWGQWDSSRPYAGYLFLPSPSLAAYHAFDATFSKAAGWNEFHVSAALTHGLSWLLLALASFIVPRTWQDKALSAEAVRRRETMNRINLGSTGLRRNFRARLLDINPFYWLVARQRMRPWAVWMFLGLTAVVWGLGLYYAADDWDNMGSYVVTALILHTVLKFWLVTEACRRFSMDRQSGALELLLSTPIEVREIVRGQWLGLKRQFVWPVLLVLLADFVFMLLGDRHTSQDTFSVMLWLSGMIMFVADLITLGWVGMWRGLNSRRPNRAAAAAMVRVLVLPWMIYFLLLTFSALSNAFGSGMGNWDGKGYLILWVGIGLGVNAMFGLPARRRLLAEFREVATQRFDVGKK